MQLPFPALSLLAACISFTATARAAEFFVDPARGSDANDGKSPEHAFATIVKARDTIRNAKLNQDLKEDLVVNLRGGRYELKETLVFSPEDSGSGGHTVIYSAYKDEQPVLSGGRRVTGWKKVDGKPYFVASAPLSAGFPDWFGQLYVNGVRATRARSNTTLKVAEFTKDGIRVVPDRLRAYTNVEDIRCLWVHVFKAGDIPVEFISGDFIKMRQPAWDIWNGWGDAKKTPSFFVVNAMEELDEPGEWYLDRKTRNIYYYPFTRDDMAKAEVCAPTVECLMKVMGAHDMKFRGLTFEHGHWLDPQRKLLGRSQAEIYMGDTTTYSGELPGQILFDHATNSGMTGCTIRHMGSCGVMVGEACRKVVLEGNTTEDTTAAGITVGKFWMKQEECPAETVPTDITISNNIVRNTGRDYPQGTGINIFAAKDCQLLHNDVSDTSYTGIHARIGDSGKVNPGIGHLEYKYNKVSRVFQGHKWGIGDGGSLYMHGRYPGSLVAENYSLYTNRFVNYEYYSDNWSHTVRWVNNVSRYTHAHNNAYFAWHPGNVGVTFEGNYSDKNNTSVGKATQTDFHFVTEDQWPPEAQRIMDNAGLEPKWRHLADRVYGHENLAQGKTSTAAAGADGDWNTVYEGTGGWQVDLGAKHVIRRITILPPPKGYDENSRRNIRVQASNEADFKNAVTLCEQNEVPWYNKPGSSNMWEQYIPVMSGFRYLRVVSADPSVKIGFAEFDAYGYPTAQ